MPKTIFAGLNPKIFIESINGDLSLVGWDGEDILLKGDDDEIHCKQDGDKVSISCDDDLSLRVPKSASVFIQHIEGDASIRSVMGSIELKNITGDLSIRDAGTITIDTIKSDFSLRGAKGDLFVKSACSDVSIRNVDGNIILESASADLALRDVRGNVSANVSEDVVLYLNPQPENSYAIIAGDDILLVMPPKTNATLTLNADEIDVEWKGIERDDNATSRLITLGDGSAWVTLNAGGDIRVTNQSDAGESAEDFGNFAGIGMDWSGFGGRISPHADQVPRRAAKQTEETERRSTRRVEISSARWLKIRVTDTKTGRSKASVQIPLALVDAGLKIGAHFTPDMEDVDMTNVVDALRRGVTGKIIDVVDENDGEHVEIYVE